MYSRPAIRVSVAIVRLRVSNCTVANNPTTTPTRLPSPLGGEGLAVRGDIRHDFIFARYNSSMSDMYELPVGSLNWPIRIRPNQVLNLPRPKSHDTPAALVRDALEHPVGFEPLRRALTPDDHVAVVVDDKLPYL